MSAGDAHAARDSDAGEPALDPRLAGLLDEYFNRRQAGEQLTPQDFVRAHPELAAQIEPHLRGLALIDQARTRSLPGHATPPATAGPLPPVPGYDLLEEIGRGGMGVVYRARQLATRRIVALKVMLSGPFAPRAARRRFQREVELAARLQHPSIVGVLEGGEVAGQPYYAMDYVAGVRLDHYLRTAQPPVPALLDLFVRLCEAVEYAHGHGVVHRDLKPANILIDADGNPFILDFGLAKALDQVAELTPISNLSQPGQVVGTLHYLSPEQATGQSSAIDGRTDVYALGVLLYEALTGVLPYPKDGPPAEVIRRILEAPPVRPRTHMPQVDEDLEAIVLKALEKEPPRRYQSAHELAEDLRRYLRAEPVRAHRASHLYVLRKRLHRHRLTVTLIVVAACLIAGGWLATVWQRHRALAAARCEAVECQRTLEAEPGPAPGGAEALLARFPQLPEAPLVFAQAQYRNEPTRERAILFLERRLSPAPEQWACRALLAEMYRASGDATRADVLVAEAERAAPQTAEAWHVRSFATLDLDRARHYAEQAVRLDPTIAPAWQRLTSLRLRAGDADGALEAAARLIALGADAGRWMIFKAQVLATQRRFREAIAEYTRLIERDASYSGVYAHRAHAYRRAGEYEIAVADYDRLLPAGAAVDPWHLYQRATPLWILGRTEEALADYRRVRELLGRPFHSDARRFLILAHAGRRDEADAVLAAALRDVQDPWLRQVFTCLSGQLSPADLVASAAARGDPKHNCEARYYAGEVCLLRGEREAARDWFQQCVDTGLEFDPGTVPAVPMNEYELAEWRLRTLGPTMVPARR
jgi:tetratricopeptide (TPR) repeat protein